MGCAHVVLHVLAEFVLMGNCKYCNGFELSRHVLRRYGT